ncbi:hypothetical protein OUZ56_003425 [Daphnia magna]|uniref:Uncharacterized protein n=1 Tax=Daphnia magna TaxID=35525 RepID=A0ABR0A8Q4_9CRUS|nr:hypothetical protein OUZ56_003425 [Daphnia magna]
MAISLKSGKNFLSSYEEEQENSCFVLGEDYLLPKPTSSANGSPSRKLCSRPSSQTFQSACGKDRNIGSNRKPVSEQDLKKNLIGLAFDS